MAAATLLFMGLGSFEVLILLIPIGLTIWALIDAIKSNFQKDINKLVWIIVIVGMPFFGGILYFLIGSKQKSVV